MLIFLFVWGLGVKWIRIQFTILSFWTPTEWFKDKIDLSFLHFLGKFEAKRAQNGWKNAFYKEVLLLCKFCNHQLVGIIKNHCVLVYIDAYIVLLDHYFTDLLGDMLLSS